MKAELNQVQGRVTCFMIVWKSETFVQINSKYFVVCCRRGKTVLGLLKKQEDLKHCWWMIALDWSWVICDPWCFMEQIILRSCLSPWRYISHLVLLSIPIQFRLCQSCLRNCVIQLLSVILLCSYFQVSSRRPTAAVTHWWIFWQKFNIFYV